MDTQPQDNKATHPATPASGDGKPFKRRRPLWLRLIKWVLLTAVALVLLVLGVLGVAVWILTPKKLTPIVERVATEYLNADVTIGRVELTYWSTFPQLHVKVDSLNIVSHSLRGLSAADRDRLPSDADSLLSFTSLQGKVNIPSLMLMKVQLEDIELDRPVVNIVCLNDSVNNFDILPPSEEDTDTTSMPDITINRFSLPGGLKAAYFNAADTTDMRLVVTPSQFATDDKSTYSVSTGGNARLEIAGVALPPSVDFKLDGRIVWESHQPYELGLEDFNVGLGPVEATVNTQLDFARDLVVKSFDMQMPEVSVMSVVDWLPQEYVSSLSGMKTDLKVSLSANLTAPYDLGGKDLPSVDFSIDVPDGSLSYQQMVLKTFGLEAAGHFDGHDIDRSVIDVKRLVAVGEGIGFRFTGTATRLLSDPIIKGVFKGGVGFAKLPSSLMGMLPFTLKGRLMMDADLDLRPSYFDRLNFHKLKIDGNATLTDFILHMNDSTGDIYARHATLKFGSSSTITAKDGHRIDSLLTVSLKVDTASYMMDSLGLTGSDMRMSLGVSNKAASADTAVVIPLGLNISAQRLRYINMSDSSSVMLKSPKVGGVITRYKDSKKCPMMMTRISSDVLRYRSPEGRISLRDPQVQLRLHLNSRPRMNKRLGAIFDSISVARPSLRADSVYALARQELAAMRKRRRAAAANKPRAQRDSTDVLDLRADKETRSLLMWWDASGRITAKRGRVLTPYYPLRNVVRDMDISFDMDSLVIHNTKLKVGRSSLTVNGVISNYTNAMLRKNAAMNLRLNLSGDTIDINQLVNASFYGAAYAEKVAEGATSAVRMGDDVSDDKLEKQVESTAADSVTGPLLVPMNLDADFNMSSKVVLYEGLTLHDFRGVAMMHEGAIKLTELGATTDAGRVNLNALYSAPTKDEMTLGMGLVLTNFYIEKFNKLFPTVDSILPALNTISGRINAEMVATTDIFPNMDINLGSLSALLTIKGDSLVVIDPDTYKTISKWLMFKNKNRNMIDSISAQVAIENNQLEIYPFIFNFDRYKLGLMGNNDLAMNLNYHVSVLKSPIPFKFGINIKGTPENMKIRLGGAKVKENMVVERVTLVDTTRINLVKEMDRVFRRGVRKARLKSLNARGNKPGDMLRIDDIKNDTISAADSAVFVKEGLLPPPPSPSK